MKKQKFIFISILSCITVFNGASADEINTSHTSPTTISKFLKTLHPQYQQRLLPIQDALFFLLNLKPITLSGDQGHTKAITSVAIDNDQVITGSADCTAKIWCVHTGTLLYTLTDHTDSVTSVAIQANSVATGSKDTTAIIWDSTTGAHIFTLSGHTQGISDIAIHNDNVVTSSYDGTAKIWNLHTGELLNTIHNNTIITSIALNDDILITGCWDCMIKIWDMHTGKLLKNIAGIDGHASSISAVALQNNILVTTSYDKTAKIWQTNGTHMHTLSGRDRHSQVITCVALDNNEIVTGSFDRTAKIWNLESGEFEISLGGPDGHAHVISAVAIKDTTVVTGSWDRTAKIWPLTLDLNSISDDSPIIWIIQEATPTQLQFIQRAYAATYANKKIVISPQSSIKIDKNDSCVQNSAAYYSFPCNVQMYLANRLNIVIKE